MYFSYVNIDLELPLEVKYAKKQNLISNLSNEEVIVLQEKIKSKYSYMIFAFERIKKKYGIDYDTIVTLNYLNELGVFSNGLIIDSKKVSIRSYEDLGLISRDFEIKRKNLFRLTDKSINIVSDFNDILNDSSIFIQRNREVEVDDVDEKVSGVLANYFSK